MNAVEMAVRQLGKAIQADPRYMAFQEAKRANDADEALQQMVQEFNLKRMSYQHETEKPEEERNTEKIKQSEQHVKKLYMEIIKNPHMVAYESARQAMDAMIHEIDTIIMLCANGEDPEKCHPNLENCSGNCSACGGCH